jgi:GA-binding protein transcription factor alpha
LGAGCLDGEFIMSEPEGVAKLWGQQKGKSTMNYEKLSRALRYYKGGNILDKVHNKKFTYRFVCDLRDIVGFSAKELDRRVRDHVERAQ